MPKRALAVVASLAAVGMVVGSPARAQEPQAGEQEVSASTTKEVGTQLVEGFTVQSPFTPTAPDHLWLDNRDGTWMFLHFDKPLKDATRIIYTGWAVPGRWCAEAQPKDFTHFHRIAKVATWDAGHGGSRPGERGFWLKHVAPEEFELKMMGMEHRVARGTDPKFMPTNPPKCGKQS
jgi:hypothetical protein